MKNAIWATYYHKSSTNEQSKHELCPPGETSWCTWRKAEAQGNLHKYQHKSALHKDVRKAIHPVISFSGMKVVEVATYIATYIYNGGYSNILSILHALHITIGSNCYGMCNDEDNYRISIAEERAQATTKEARTARRRLRLSLGDLQLAEEGPQYAAGIAD